MLFNSTSTAIVAAVAAIGVREIYVNGFSRILRKETEDSIREHECRPTEKLELAWSFHDSGFYAAAVHKSDEFLSIIIYDCIEKTAYDYLRESTYLKPDYFYWFNGDIILLYIEHRCYIQQIRIKLDREKRRANCIQTRNSAFPFLIDETGRDYLPFIKKIKHKPLVEVMQTVSIENEDYVVVQNNSCVGIIMIPKDPNSTLSVRYSLYFFPRNNKIMVNGHVFFQLLQPICYQQFIYYPKLARLSSTNTVEHKYILDGFIEVNLRNLDNVVGKEFDISELINVGTTGGREVFFYHVGTVPEDILQPRTILSSKQCGDGQSIAVRGFKHKQSLLLSY